MNALSMGFLVGCLLSLSLVVGCGDEGGSGSAGAPSARTPEVGPEAFAHCGEYLSCTMTRRGYPDIGPVETSTTENLGGCVLLDIVGDRGENTYYFEGGEGHVLQVPATWSRLDDVITFELGEDTRLVCEHSLNAAKKRASSSRGTGCVGTCYGYGPGDCGAAGCEGRFDYNGTFSCSGTPTGCDD